MPENRRSKEKITRDDPNPNVLTPGGEPMQIPGPKVLDAPVNADETRAVEGDTPTWAVDEQPEVPEVDPRYRREQLDRLRGNGAASDAARGVQVLGPKTAQLATMLQENAALVIDTSANAIEDIVGRVLDAETVDDVLADDSAIGADEILGVPIQIWSVKVNESEVQGALPFYAVIEGVRQDTGENVVVTCGSVKVCAQLMKLDRLKAFPVVVKIVKKDKATLAGYFPLALVKA